jgi:hypothetical protein
MGGSGFYIWQGQRMDNMPLSRCFVVEKDPQYSLFFGLYRGSAIINTISLAQRSCAKPGFLRDEIL